MKSVRRDRSPGSLNRLWPATGAFLSAVFFGGAGYHIIGGGRWDLSSSMYMAVVTLSTVGFSETLPGMAEPPWARPWTVLLILFGSGSLLYFASTVTARALRQDLRIISKVV